MRDNTRDTRENAQEHAQARRGRAAAAGIGIGEHRDREGTMTIWDGLSQAFKLGRAYEKDRAAQRNDREHDALGEWASDELAKLAAAVRQGPEAE